MLKMKYLFENFDLARLALRNYPHDEDTPDKALSWFRISANAVYPYFCGGEMCFLRLAPADERTREGILAEIEFIEYLRASGYPAMEPIAALGGEKCLTLDTEWGVWHACAFRRVAGTQMEDAELTDDALFDYGRALGRLHRLSEAYKPVMRRQSHEDLLAWAERVMLAQSAPEHMLAELRDVRAALAALPRTDYGLVHYDFEPDNVFYSPGERACAVIDFDDCVYHWYALDVEQVFDSLDEFFEDEAALSAAKERFLCGYRSERAFTDEMLASLPLMRRAVNLYGYARLKHCMSEPTGQRPDWLCALEAKLGAKAERIERSVSGEL